MDSLQAVSEVDDPRVTGKYLRECVGAGGRGVVLVGVVHDHPASAYRVQTITEAVDPDVLAVELPPMAVSLFEQYADDGQTPPTFGGEMSAAIQAATTDHVVGIDGPSISFVGRLARTLVREGVPASTGTSIARGFASVTKQAVVCRMAAAVADWQSVRIEVDALSSSYDTDWRDEPETQADDERKQVQKATSVLQAFGSTPASRLRNETREVHMATRLSSLCREGDVVAVVGIDHLDPVAEQLEDRLSTR